MSDFLLELGTEELPANFANEAVVELKDLTSGWLKNNSLKFDSLDTYSTPRRLVVVIKGLQDSQPDTVKEVKGPAVSSAYDSEGKPSKALEGFCKSQGVSLDSLEQRELKGNLFIYAQIKQEGKKTSSLLPDLIKNLISSISVTRGMRWADFTTKFSRPIHWILSLFDGKVIDFTLEDVSSSNFTKGHRFLSQGQLEVNSIDEYFNVLSENKVIVKNEERKEIIRKQLNDLANSFNAKVLIPESLLEEVNQLVEFPYAISGTFDEKYLVIPEAVNVTVMKSHQRYFPLFDQNDKLLPRFITISNMNLNPDNIRAGNERVLRARLEDAIFYYYEDLKVSLEENAEALKKVTYFEEIGSIYDKSERIEKIALHLAQNYFTGLNNSDVSKASKLCKADLVTGMVQEFTELQGEIGYYYSQKAGEKEDISVAYKEQYLPIGNSDALASKPLSQVVNFADKLDNLVSCFALGKIPTGSKDPFSLRRQSLGIIKTCDKYNISLNIQSLFEFAFDVLVEQKGVKAEKSEVVGKLVEFFTQRLKNDLVDKGFRHDLIDSVLNSKNPLSDISSVSTKIKSLGDWLDSDSSKDTVTALARVIRICKVDYNNEIDSSLFEKEQEGALFNIVISLKEELNKLFTDKNFDEYLNKLNTLVVPVNNFFDNVMVMAEDEKVKNNRLSLLTSIKSFSEVIANFDKIVL